MKFLMNFSRTEKILFGITVTLLFCILSILIASMITNMMESSSRVSESQGEIEPRLMKMPPTWTPGPTETIEKNINSNSMTSQPTKPSLQSPTKSIPNILDTPTPQPATIPEVNDQNYPMVYNPSEILVDIDRFEGKTFRVQLFIRSVKVIEQNGQQILLFQLTDTLNKRSSHRPLIVYGPPARKYSQLEQGFLITIYAIGIGKVEMVDEIGKTVLMPAAIGVDYFVNCSSRFGCR